MQNLGAGAHEYFRTLNLILTIDTALGIYSSKLKLNFSGCALGYFSAHSRRVLRIKVQ
jgi:hypothetical protein